MKLTIFSRLLLGYLIIFALVTVINAYAILEIGHINKLTESILTVNNQTIELAKELSDTILSQVGYERKYIISGDEAFFNGFIRLNRDFERFLKEMVFVADSAQMRTALSRIDESYKKYQSLFQDEMKRMRTGSRYPRQGFDLEKKKLTGSIVDELENLEIDAKQNTDDKIKRLHGIGTRLRRTVSMMTLTFLILGIVISLSINRSITRPLSTLEVKTKEIGKGKFKGDLNIHSPPELAELGDAFNLMCRKLNELDKMKSDFFSSVAHEFRTPLTTMKMGADLMQADLEGPLTKGQRNLLSVLEKEIHRLTELVNSILDLSKMEAGMMSFHFTPENIGPLIDRAIQEMSLLIEGKKITIEVTLAKELPLLKIDSGKMLQALRNIIGNAVKFTPDAGHVAISAHPANHGVEVSVADTGPGIPLENLASIFEKFQQAPTGGSSRMKGTGLGLAISKEIINRHGGKIWAESQFGHGSKIIFVLPT